MTHRFIRGLGAALFLLAAGTAGATTFHINAEGTGDAATIQGAIDSLVVGDFDEIVLADGVYTGEGNRDILNREKVFHLRSESGDPTRCIIDLEGTAEDWHFGLRFACN